MSDIYAGSDKKALEQTDELVEKKKSSDDKRNDTGEMTPFDTVKLALQLDFTAKMAAAIEDSSNNNSFNSDNCGKKDDEEGPSFQIDETRN